MTKVKIAKFKRFAQKIKKLNAGKLTAKKTVKLLISLSKVGVNLDKITHDHTTKYLFKADYVTKQLIGSEHIGSFVGIKPFDSLFSNEDKLRNVS